MDVQLSGNKIAQQNVQNANSLLATAEGNLDVVQDNLSRIRDLTLQAKNGTYSDDEIQAMQDEVDQRIKEINRVSQSSKFSQLNLFENNTDMRDSGVTFQVGANGDVNNTINATGSIFKSVQFSELTCIQNLNLKSITDQQASSTISDPTSKAEVTDFETALAYIDYGIDNITSRKSEIGSVGNRLDSALNTLTTQYENLSSAKSIITDADIASEASAFTQNQILQQVSTSLLAQANQAPSVALSLI